MTACGECDGEIKSLREAIDVVLGLENDPFRADRWPSHKFPFGLWFRGQSIFGKPLEPPVFREKKKGSRDYSDETNLFEHLRGRAPGHSDRYSTAFDWLCLMQHYSVPTRLLDWSEGVLPALYFAVNKKSEDKWDGELIVLNARRLNRIQKPRPTISTPKQPAVIIQAEMARTRSVNTLIHERAVVDAFAEMEITDPTAKDVLEKFRRPIAVFPYRLNDRMIFQASVFTLHGGKRYPKRLAEAYKGDSMPDPISLEEVNKKEGCRILRRYRVPKGKCKQKIRHELFVLGIHEGTLFPEIDRQAVYLKELW